MGRKKGSVLRGVSVPQKLHPHIVFRSLGEHWLSKHYPHTLSSGLNAAMSWFSPSPGVQGTQERILWHRTPTGFQMRKSALLLLERTKTGVWSRNFHILKTVTWRNSCWFPFPPAVGDVLCIKTLHSREMQWDENILDPFIHSIKQCQKLHPNSSCFLEPQSCMQVPWIVK